MKPLFASLLLAALFSHTVLAADAPAEADSPATEAPSPEQAVVNDLKALPLKGEPLTLSAGGEEVFALFLPAHGGEEFGGVILLHDTNAHADSRNVIHPLRTRLPEAGWASLSVQLPFTADGQVTPALLDMAQRRIGAAIAELQRRGSNTIALVGHGSGALAAVDYLAAADNLVVQGVVVISMNGTPQAEERQDGAALLEKLRPPILDIYGGRDHSNVIDSAGRRAEAAQSRSGAEGPALRYGDIARDYSEEKGSKLGYRQLRIAAADHNYTHHEAMLVRHVRGWLKRYVARTGEEPEE